jgi:anti-anti-sigma factor
MFDTTDRTEWSEAPDYPGLLAMDGEIDIANEDEWRRRGDELFDSDPDLRDLTVDLANVAFLDSRGMAVLVHLHGHVVARGGKLSLRAVPPRIAFALSVAGLDQVFEVEAS